MRLNERSGASLLVGRNATKQFELRREPCRRAAILEDTFDHPRDLDNNLPVKGLGQDAKPSFLFAACQVHIARNKEAVDPEAGEQLAGNENPIRPVSTQVNIQKRHVRVAGLCELQSQLGARCWSEDQVPGGCKG